ncbi:MAG TPA: DUF1552 domain-containing protein [Terriglobia bacterium]|jgi:hypothetical protein
MFNTKQHMSRRTLLRGAGAAIALPFLDAMCPAGTLLARTAAVPAAPRFLGLVSAHGWACTYWHDSNDTDLAPTSGRNIGLGFIHKPLEPFQEQLTIVAGLDATSSMPPPGMTGGDHARLAASMTGAPPSRTGIFLGPSVDQLIAQKYGQNDLLPSLQVGIEDPGSNTGVCGWGYSCSYTNSISWAGATKPLPHEISPQVVFERLYGDGASPEQRLARKKANASILDRVMGRISSVNQTLSPADRSRLNDYLENVREVERRVQLSANAVLEAPDVDVSDGAARSIDEHIKLMWDLQFLAFQANITRVSALLLVRDESSTSYPESGVNTAHHASSHHGEDPVRREDYAKINRYHTKLLANFLQKMKDTPDGDGNMLDNSLVLWTSNMGNANQHSHVNVGSLIVGGASGRHKTGTVRNIVAKGPTSNFLLSLLHMYGIEKESIGDSTATVSLT